jgi:hypothetical protein
VIKQIKLRFNYQKSEISDMDRIVVNKIMDTRITINEVTTVPVLLWEVSKKMLAACLL